MLEKCAGEGWKFLKPADMREIQCAPKRVFGLQPPMGIATRQIFLLERADELAKRYVRGRVPNSRELALDAFGDLLEAGLAQSHLVLPRQLGACIRISNDRKPHEIWRGQDEFLQRVVEIQQ